ncbi:ABC transporter permease [Pseudoflavonifractor sp. 524-17]|uniref:ABC transporter permease n=1 Tax=Pseudoflavonifractor sp. 524-17 TaxID=2304577 RepID=UPI00137A4B0F|nr:ABC transporter permease [Pseudoflavonifractor sp. 524-17]NCE63805.1 ABC transporter permease [Pseudoflavonifractor sp. 524-17]
MRSETLSSKPCRVCGWFNFTLFQKNLTRFWPVWTLYSVLWFLILPTNFLTSRDRIIRHEGAAYYREAVIDLIPSGIFLSLFFGVLAAMAVFSYLYNSRAAGMMHALPIRREGLFLTNYLSGLCFFLLPIGAVAVLTLLVQVYIGVGLDLTALFLWTWCQAMFSLFFYSFAVFCAMFTGNIVALPVFYGVLNALAYGLYLLFSAMADLFLFGYYGGTIGMDHLIVWLTPVIRLGRTVGSSGAPDYRLTGLLSIFVYALAGVVLAALSAALYHRRHIETAGDVVAVSWVKPIFKYGVAFCSAVALGTFFWSLFFLASTNSAWPLLLFMLFTGVWGYFVAEMLMRKSFRVFRKSWPGGAAFALVLVLAAGAMEFDLTGFESRVPQASQVAEVTLESYSLSPLDSGGYGCYRLNRPEDIARVAALHQAVVRSKADLPDEQGAYASWIPSAAYPNWDIQISGTQHLRLTYLLKGGGTLIRQYWIPVDEDLLKNEASPAAQLDRLINDPEQILFQYFASNGCQEGDPLLSAELSTLDGPAVIPTDLLEELLDAIQSDLAEGRLGRHYLLDSEERYTNCYFNDITLHFAAAGADRRYDYTVTITVQSTAGATLKVLEQAGLTETLVTKGDSMW